MTPIDEAQARPSKRWWDVAGWSQLLKSFSMAMSPAKLGLALAALAFSLVWGVVLDWIWVKAGAGVEQQATVVRPVIQEEDGEAEAQVARAGVFETWWELERTAMLGCASAVRHGNLLGSFAAEPPDPRLRLLNSLAPDAGPDIFGRTMGLMGCVGQMVSGVTWLVREHWFYAILFLGGSLIVWAWLGGAICRMHAVQYAVDIRVSPTAALAYSQERLFGGFVAAPLMPLIFVLIIGLVLVIGGLVLSIPWLGDILGGLLFGFAILAGGVIAFTLLAALLSSFLFWPAIAADSYDGPAAVLHTVSYVQTRLGRALWYLLLTVVLASITWIVVNWLVWFAMACAGVFVEIGALPGERLQTVWGLGGPSAFFTAARPEGARDTVLWTLIGAWMALFVGLIWAYMVSFWLGCGTIAYFLLRSSVDNISFAEVSLTNEERDLLEQTGELEAAPPEEAENPQAVGDKMIENPGAGDAT